MLQETIRPTGARWWQVGAAVAVLAVMTLAGAGEPLEAQEIPEALQPLELRLPEDGTWSRFEVEKKSFSKKVRFRNLETSVETVVKLKGIPYSRTTPVGLFVDPDVFEKKAHRMRYRFPHPLSGKPLVLRARSASRRVLGVPVRSDVTAPVVELLDGDGKDDDAPVAGQLAYDYHSPILFTGELRGRRVEIERLDEPLVPEKGAFKHFLFPFPLRGEFTVRLDGVEVARFVQHPEQGTRSQYDLGISAAGDRQTEEDAMLAFVIFGLMKDFVASS